MFGYIQPFTPDLRIREYRYFRGVYCGLCRAMGRCTGQCSRLTLSYDFTFLALVRLALLGGNPVGGDARAVRFETRRCLAHPLSKRPSLATGDVTEYVACAAAILNDYKLRDDVADERGGKRVRAKIASPAVRRMARCARRKYPELAETIGEKMAAFSEWEKNGEIPSADLPAAAFGEVLAAVFCHGLTGDAERIARAVGFHVGKWLYLIDAVDDYAEDRQKGRYNPLIALYGGEVPDEERRADLTAALRAECMRARDAMALARIDAETCGAELAPLLEHIWEVALPRTTGEIVSGCGEPKKKRKRRKMEERE